MATHATGQFEIKNWDEKTYAEIGEGGKLTRASVTQAFHGDIEGEGSVEYLMVYPDGQSASFVGLQRIAGQVGGRAGSLVLQVNGTFANGLAKGAWHVVPGANTGDLRGLRGSGDFSATHGMTADITLDYSFAE